MAAATSDQIRVAWSLPELAPNVAHTVLANKTIYQGSLAMLVAGKAQPYVSGTSGSTMLGVALRQYAAPPAADLVLLDGEQAVFRRGDFACSGKAGDLPDETFVGKVVYFDDSSLTVKATPAANDLGGVLRAITEGYFIVEVA